MTITPTDIAAVVLFLIAWGALVFEHWRGMLDEAHDAAADIEAQERVLTSIRLARGWRTL